MYQSGHGGTGGKNYQVTTEGYQLDPPKPVLDGEPNYEDHPINWRPENGWFTSFDTRRAAWWSFLAGACGHTYGNHNIWQMWQPGREPISRARTPWRQALNQEGAFQMGYLAQFLQSLSWQDLEPGQKLIALGPNTEGKDIRAAIGKDRGMALIYSPWGSSFGVNMSLLEGRLYKAIWWNPRIGESILTDAVDTEEEVVLFDPPSDEREGNDWILYLERFE